MLSRAELEDAVWAASGARPASGFDAGSGASGSAALASDFADIWASEPEGSHRPDSAARKKIAASGFDASETRREGEFRVIPGETVSR